MARWDSKVRHFRSYLGLRELLSPSPGTLRRGLQGLLARGAKRTKLTNVPRTCSTHSRGLVSPVGIMSTALTIMINHA